MDLGFIVGGKEPLSSKGITYVLTHRNCNNTRDEWFEHRYKRGIGHGNIQWEGDNGSRLDESGVQVFYFIRLLITFLTISFPLGRDSFEYQPLFPPLGGEIYLFRWQHGHTVVRNVQPPHHHVSTQQRRLCPRRVRHVSSLGKIFSFIILPYAPCAWFPLHHISTQRRQQGLRRVWPSRALVSLFLL